MTYIPMRSDDWRSIHGSTLLRDIEAVVKGFNKHVIKPINSIKKTRGGLGSEPQTAEEACLTIQSILMKDFLSFVKPFNSELPKDHPDNYYMEREWRKYGNMLFWDEQIVRILVASGYKQRIEKDFPQFIGQVDEI